MASNLWLWHRAQLTVIPMNVSVVVATRSSSASWRPPPSGPRRRKPVAIIASSDARVELVARDLLPDEAIVGLVRVERLDQVVAVAVHLGPVHVELEPAGVRVADQIHPVARPALAVVRRGQQAIDQPRPRVGRGVVDEGVDLGGRRRQAEHVEVRAAHQRPLAGRGRRRQPARLHGRQQEGVDRVAAPRRVRHRRRRAAHRLDEGPVGAFGVGDRPLFQLRHLRRRRGRVRRRLRHAGDRGAGFDPQPDGVERFVRELAAAGRHERGFGVADVPEQAALVRLVGDDDGAAGAALAEAFLGAQVEAAGPGDAVTLEALLLEDAVDLPGQRVGALGLGGRNLRRGRGVKGASLVPRRRGPQHDSGGHGGDRDDRGQPAAGHAAHGNASRAQWDAGQRASHVGRELAVPVNKMAGCVSSLVTGHG